MDRILTEAETELELARRLMREGRISDVDEVLGRVLDSLRCEEYLVKYGVISEAGYRTLVPGLSSDERARLCMEVAKLRDYLVRESLRRRLLSGMSIVSRIITSYGVDKLVKWYKYCILRRDKCYETFQRMTKRLGLPESYYAYVLSLEKVEEVILRRNGFDKCSKTEELGILVCRDRDGRKVIFDALREKIIYVLD